MGLLDSLKDGSAPLTDSENDLLGQYGEVIEKRGTRFVARESEFPSRNLSFKRC
jgi:hypothetical protein